MPINLFGFTIGRQENNESGANDVVAPDSYDGSYTLDSGSVYGGFMSTYTDFSGGAKTEEEFINFSILQKTLIFCLDAGMLTANCFSTL